MLINHALMATEEGPLGIATREEIKVAISLHYGIPKHEFYVYRSFPDPYIIIFNDRAARDLEARIGSRSQRSDWRKKFWPKNGAS